MTEQDLITALKEGQEGAFTTLLATYRPRVVNTCFGFTRQKQDAEDVAQEVFLEVFRGLKKFEGNVPLWVWLYRLAVNKSIDFLRSKNRQKRISRLKSLFREDGSSLDIVDSSDALTVLEKKELKELLKRVVNRLPQRQRTAFVLSRHEGLTNARIARVMNITEGAVESLITRANGHLRKWLKNYYDQKI